MNKSKKTCKLLTEHGQTYPKLQLWDVFKFIYQSVCGCEHMALSLESATAGIIKEHQGICPESDAKIEQLDGKYCRVHLSILNDGISSDTLAKLFVLSAKKEANAKAKITHKLKIAKQVVCDDMNLFSKDEFEKQSAHWKKTGYTSVHHSDVFRKEYNPSYRVIAKEYIPFLPLFSKLDKMLKKGTVKVAIDGPSASGKTTLSKILGDVYDCTVFHMDDFFLRPEQRTPQRFSMAGENVDHERFLSEVLVPLQKGDEINYRKFDCRDMKIKEGKKITSKKLIVTEGAYSMHPKLAGCYDFSVFLDIDAKLQKKRILHRNTPKEAKLFFDKWIPLEKAYFSEFKIKDKCSMQICITE